MIRSRDGGLQLGPHDEGLELEHDAFVSATWEPGYRYELVAGRLAETPRRAAGAGGRPEPALQLVASARRRSFSNV
jgi:hypothetical protein